MLLFISREVKSFMEDEVLYVKIKTLLGQYEGLHLEDKKKGTGHFRFPVYIRDEYKNVDISALALTERAHNCLKRAQIFTIYDLMTKISGRADLARIRGCGENTSRLIMEELFVFQYIQLKSDQRDWYINRIAEMNK